MLSPPYSRELEEAVLGALFFDPDCSVRVFSLLRAEDFFCDAYAKIYRVIRELDNAGKPFDPIMVKDRLLTTGQFEEIGGDMALVKIMESVPHSANAEYHARNVLEKSRIRQVITAAEEVSKGGYLGDTLAEDLIRTWEKSVVKIMATSGPGASQAIGSIVPGIVSEIESPTDRVRGLPTGFGFLDEAIGGLKPGQLIIIGARPSMGKTVLAHQICQNLSIRLGERTTFISLEMRKEEMAIRSLAAEAKIDSKHLADYRMNGDEMAKVAKVLEDPKFMKAPLQIMDPPSMTLADIVLAAKVEKSLGTKLLVIDYLQLIREDPSGSRKNRTRNEVLQEITGRLKELARELSIPVIAVSQLKRNDEKPETRPVMSDLRESGSIEQDADLILLLHRPGYYPPFKDPEQSEVILAKHRSGERSRVVNLIFRGEQYRFSERENEEAETTQDTFF